MASRLNPYLNFDGNARQAMEFYEQTIDAAHQEEFLQEEALANELASRYYRCLLYTSPSPRD